MRLTEFTIGKVIKKESTRVYTDLEKAIMEGGHSLNKPTPSINDLMKKHNVGYKYLMVQLQQGIKIELEHTSDIATAKEIALDHLSERPDYYEQLKKVEEHKKGVRAKKYTKKPKKYIEPIKPKAPE